MRPVSDAFLAAAAGSHIHAARVDVLQDRLLTMDGLPLVSGSVTLDRTAEIRGSCSVTIGTRDDGTLPRDLVPVGAFDPLAPFGTELQLWVGVQLVTGPELVSLGIFGIQDSKVSDDGSQIAITGRDRAQLVKDADFEATYSIPAGTNYADAIQDLIETGVPGLTYSFATTTATTPLLVYSDDSGEGRWAAAQHLAAHIGCDLYFDADGICVLTPVPQPSNDPAVTLSDGPGGVIVSASKAWSREPSYNRVIAYSTDAGTTPVRAVATDTDPTSPTYYGPGFGKKPLRLPGTYTTTGQAQVAADAKLREVLGVAQTLELSVAPNPALEPGDLATIQHVATGIDEVDIIDTATYDLGLGAMSLGVRARQVTQ